MNRAWLVLFAVVLFPQILPAVPQRIVIVHTSEIHSNLAGHEPVTEYSPELTGNDATLGGAARLAALIQHVRRKHGEETFVLDGGDFSMGSPTAFLFRSHAFEIRTLALLGYDAAALGEHEFYLGSGGLASSALAAERLSPIPLPALLTSNLSLRRGSAGRDDAFSGPPFAERAVLQRGHARIGVFAVMNGDTGLRELEFPDGVLATDPIFASRIAVTRLREEKVDAVVCLCHMTIESAVNLAKAVSGIDVIVAGHGGALLPRPILSNRTWIVQSGQGGTHAGVMRLRRRDPSGLELEDYQLRTIDDSLQGAPEIVRAVSEFNAESAPLLRGRGVDSERIIARTLFDLDLVPRSQALIFLSADGILAAARRFTPAGTPQVNASLQLAGSIESPIRRGHTGVITGADAFRVTPLGSGPDGEIGSPIVAFSLDGRDLRMLFELLLYRSTDEDDVFPSPAGLRVEFDPARIPLDRVTSLQLETSSGLTEIPRHSGPPYYKIAMSLHNARLILNEAAAFRGILSVTPRRDNGESASDLRSTILDADPGAPGIQEVKEWQSFRAYLQSLPDADGDGTPDVPAWVLDPPKRVIIEIHGVVRFLADPGPLTSAAGIAALSLAHGLFVIMNGLFRVLVSSILGFIRSKPRAKNRGSS